jgi:hypothetical protein
VTNVPAQALAMLNDPFVTGQAESWGNRVSGVRHGTVDERIVAMFKDGLGRPPSAAEVDRWSSLVREFAAEHGIAEPAILQSAAIWKDVAHALFNVKEFIYIR